MDELPDGEPGGLDDDPGDLDDGKSAGESAEDEFVSGCGLRTDVSREDGMRMGHVMLSDRSILRTFRLTNEGKDDVSVCLSSTLPGQLAFQLTNPNLALENPSDHNEVFNRVGHVAAARVRAGEIRVIVVCFRPSEESLAALNIDDSEGDDVDDEALGSPNSSGATGTQRRSIVVRGTVSLTLSHRTAALASDAALKPLQFQFSVILCRSALTVSEHAVAFGKCRPGRAYTRELVVRNQSKVPTAIIASVLGREGAIQTRTRAVLDLRDAATGRRLPRPRVVRAGGRAVCRLVFRPPHVGSFDYTVRITDSSDDRVRPIDVRVTATAKEPPGERHGSSEDTCLEVRMAPIRTSKTAKLGPMLGVGGEAAAQLSFDDCYVGMRAKRVIIVRNTSRSTVDVRFTAIEEAPGDAVAFSLCDPDEGDIHTESEARTASSIDTKALVLDTKRDAQVEREEDDDGRVDFIDETSLPTGASVYIAVWYVPGVPDETMRNLSSPRPAVIGRATKRTFCVTLQATKRSKDDRTEPSHGGAVVVEAKATVRQSRLQVSRSDIKFGDVHIGTKRNVEFFVSNLCDAPGRFELDYVSKCVTCHVLPLPGDDANQDGADGEGYAVPANGSRKIIMYFVPRKTNPEYYKEVIVRNMNRREGHSMEQSITPNSSRRSESATVARAPPLKVIVRANIIPSQIELVPSFFLRVVPPPSSTLPNCINFGALKVSCPSVRAFGLQNTRRSSLSLLLSTSAPEEIKLYRVRAEGKARVAAETRLEAALSDPPLPDSVMTADQQKRRVRAEMRRRNHLSALLSSGELSPLETLRLAGGEKMKIFVVYRMSPRTWIGGRFTNAQGTIQIRMDKFDRSLLPQAPAPRAPSEAPTLTIPLQAKVCEVRIALSQTSINFGEIEGLSDGGATRKRTLRLGNPSDVPLLYRLEKTGSVSSGDLRFPENLRSGVVRPLAEREIPFEFAPSFPGTFRERVTLVNVLDPTANAVVKVKAKVKQRVNFWLRGLSLDFGRCVSGQPSELRRIVIKNVTNRERSFVITHQKSSNSDATEYKSDPSGRAPPLSPRGGPMSPPRAPKSPVQSPLGTPQKDAHRAGPKGPRPVIIFRMAERQALGTAGEVAKQEEERERLTLKLRVAIRKKKTEKIKKITERLAALGRLLEAEDRIVGGDTADSAPGRGGGGPSSGAEKEVSGRITFSLMANAIQVIHVRLVAEMDTREGVDVASTARLAGTLSVHEKKNRDVIKEVSFSADIVPSATRLVANLEVRRRPKPIKVPEAPDSTREPTLSPIPLPFRKTTSMTSFASSKSGGGRPSSPLSTRSHTLGDWEDRIIEARESTGGPPLTVTIPRDFKPLRPPRFGHTRDAPVAEMCVLPMQSGETMYVRGVVVLRQHTTQRFARVRLEWKDAESKRAAGTGQTHATVTATVTPTVSFRPFLATQAPSRDVVSGSSGEEWAAGSLQAVLRGTQRHFVNFRIEKKTLNSCAVGRQDGALGGLLVFLDGIPCALVKVLPRPCAWPFKLSLAAATTLQNQQLDYDGRSSRHLIVRLTRAGGAQVENLALQLSAEGATGGYSVKASFDEPANDRENSVTIPQSESSKDGVACKALIQFSRPATAPQHMYFWLALRAKGTGGLAAPKLRVNASTLFARYVSITRVESDRKAGAEAMAGTGDTDGKMDSVDLGGIYFTPPHIAQSTGTTQGDVSAMEVTHERSRVATVLIVRSLRPGATPIRLKTTSLSPSQVHLFADAELSKKFPDVLNLRRGEPARVFVVVRPGLTRAARISGACRSFASAIRFEVLAGRNGGVVSARVIQLRGRVAMALMAVSVGPGSDPVRLGPDRLVPGAVDPNSGALGACPIDMGRVETLGSEACVTIRIRNRTRGLPLRFEVSADAGVRVTPGDTLSPRGQNGDERLITAHVRATHFGLVQRCIHVQNLCAAEPLGRLCITARLFVDPKAISMSAVSDGLTARGDAAEAKATTTTISQPLQPFPRKETGKETGGLSATCDLGTVYVYAMDSDHFEGLDTNTQSEPHASAHQSEQDTQTESDAQHDAAASRLGPQNGTAGAKGRRRPEPDDDTGAEISDSDPDPSDAHTQNAESTPVAQRTREGVPSWATALSLREGSSSFEDSHGVLRPWLWRKISPDRDARQTGDNESDSAESTVESESHRLQDLRFTDRMRRLFGLASQDAVPAELPFAARDRSRAEMEMQGNEKELKSKGGRGAPVSVRAVRHSRRVFRVENLSKMRPITVRPKSSNPGLSVVWKGDSGLPASTAARTTTSFPDPSPFDPSASGVTLEPGEARHFTVSYRHTAALASDSLAFRRLLRGEKVNFRALLVLESPDVVMAPGVVADSTLSSASAAKGHMAVAALVVCGALCLSRSRVLTSQFDVGSIGSVNKWRDVSLAVPIKNLSDVPLTLRIRQTEKAGPVSLMRSSTENQAPTLPLQDSKRGRGSSNDEDGGNDGRGNDVASTVTTGAGGTTALRLALRTSAIPVGPFEFTIQLENTNNQSEIHTVSVRGRVLDRLLAFNRLQSRAEGFSGPGNAARALVLPPIELPGTAARPAQAEEWFSIRNLTDSRCELEIDVGIAAPLAALVEMAVIGRSANAPLSALLLHSSGRTEVRVRCAVRAGVSSDAVRAALAGMAHSSDNSTGDRESLGSGSYASVQLGTVSLRSAGADIEETIEILGAFDDSQRSPGSGAQRVGKPGSVSPEFMALATGSPRTPDATALGAPAKPQGDENDANSGEVDNVPVAPTRKTVMEFLTTSEQSPNTSGRGLSEAKLRQAREQVKGDAAAVPRRLVSREDALRAVSALYQDPDSSINAADLLGQLQRLISGEQGASK